MTIDNIPEDITRGSHTVIVTVTSQDTDVSASYPFRVVVDAYYELELDLNETTTIKTVQPGDDIEFKFIVRNRGNGDDKLSLDAGILGNPPNWGTNVFPFSGASIDKNDYRDVKITISAPENDTYPHKVTVYLNVSSQDEPTAYQYTTVQVKLAQIQDVDIVVPSSETLNGTTKTVSFLLLVKNNGNGEDTFEFSVTGSFPTGELWNYDFDPYSLTLDSKYDLNNEGYVYLNFTAPDDAQFGSFQLTVNIYSSSNTSVTDSGIITIIVKELYNIKLFRLVNEKQTAYPGDNLTIQFEGTNTGNFVDTFYLSMDGPPAVGDWDPEFDPGLFSNLQPDATQSGYLNITIFKDANQGFYVLTITAESATADPPRTSSFTINVTVKQKYDIDLSTTTQTLSTDPGIPASFQFTVKNRGTGTSNITMSTTMTSEISGYMNVKFTPKAFLLSHAKDEQVVWINLTPSSASPLAAMNTTTGVPITVNADIDDRAGGPEENEIIYVKINQTFNVQIWPDALEKTVKPGTRINFSIEIRNTGNGPDSFSIQTGSVFPTWTVALSTPNTQNLEQDGVETVIMSVDVPKNEKAEYDNITINVSSRNAMVEGLDVFEIEEVTINVRSPVTGLNLTVKDGTRSKNTNPGSTVQFNLSATNTGVDIDAFTFEVDYTNKDFVKEWSLSPMLTGDMDPDATMDLLMIFKLKTNAASDFINITIKGTSKNNVNTVEIFQVSIWVNPIFKLKLTYNYMTPRQGEKALPGTNATFQIVVKNEGTGVDTIELEIEENYADISAILDDYTLVLSGSQSRTTTLTVILPEEPDDLDITIELTATSQIDDEDPPAADKENVVFSIDPTRDVDLSAVETNLELEPNLESTKASIDYSITVTNKGRDSDSFKITIEDIGSEYANWFSHPAESAKIDADKATTITVTVEVPNKWDPETITFSVRATSVENAAKSDKESFTLKILEAYGVDLEAKDDVDKISLKNVAVINDERKVDFILNVRNLGTATDSFKLIVVESEYSTWATISPAEVSNVPAYQIMTATLTVKVPKDTPVGDIKLTIKAISGGEDDKFDENNDPTDSLEVWITVDQIYDVYIPNPTNTDHGEPGELIQFPLSVKNRGNSQDEVLIDLKDKGDWPWTLSKTSLTLAAGEQVEITLSVVIPSDAEVKTGGYNVNLTLVSDTPEGDEVHLARGDLTFNIKVDQEYDVLLSITKSRLDGDPGDTVEFRISLKNLGNGYDTFDLEYSLEESSDNILPDLDIELNRDLITIPPFEFAYIWLNVSIPDIDEINDLKKITADVYRIEVHAKSLDGDDVKDQLDLNIGIEEKYLLEVVADDPRPVDDALEANADDPDGVKFFVTVTNKGNGDDDADLGTLDREPDYWDVKFQVDKISKTSIKLEPGESQRVEIIVTFEDRVDAGTDYVGFTAKSKGNKAKYGLSLSNRVYIEVKIYTLKITSIEFENTPQVGQKVQVTATIENIGNGDAEDITVSFKDGDDVLLDTKKIDKIEAGQTESVWIDWEATEGSHKIKVEVSQYDGTEESLEKSVTPETELLSAAMQTYLIIGIIVLIVLLALMAAWSVRRRRELPPDVKAELAKLRKESEMRKGRHEPEFDKSQELGAPGAGAAGAGAAALPSVGKFKELPPGPDEEEAPVKATKIKCPKCDKIQTVPSAKRPIEFGCDDCGQKLVLRKK
jgi:uncharacterized membrane protein